VPEHFLQYVAGKYAHAFFLSRVAGVSVIGSPQAKS
jgi:hypothetical protein